MELIPKAKTKDKKIKPEDINLLKKTTIAELISPPAVKVEGDHIRLGEKFVRTFFVLTYPRYLYANWISPLINLDKIIDISFYFYPHDTGAVLKNLKKKSAQVASQIAEREEKGLVRDPLLETALQDIEDLRNKLQQGTERIFKIAIYFTIYGQNIKELEDTEHEIRSILESMLVYAKPAVFQQEEGFHSVSPISDDRLQVHTFMNTRPSSTVFPFVSLDLTDDKGILYGINKHNNSLIIFDRFSLENPNLTIFATSGSGKSYQQKLEILRSLIFGSEVLVIDPESEYKYLCNAVGGEFINVSLTSPHHINPFDLARPREDELPADILRSNIVNLTGLLKIMLGGKLKPEEDAMLDKALTETYALKDIQGDKDFTGKTPPLMQDLQSVLQGTEGGESLALRLEKYTKGSYAGFFNQYTNVDVKNPFVVFSIRDMEEELRPLAMYVLLNFAWNLIRSELKKRLLVVDEAWWLMQRKEGAEFLFGVAKRCRKYYTGLTTISQDVTDFLNSPYGKSIITNSAMQILLKQSPAAIDLLTQTFALTQEEKYLLLQADVGEGIIFAGLKHAAIKVIASYSEDQIITSDPAQLLEIEAAKKEFAKAQNET